MLAAARVEANLDEALGHYLAVYDRHLFDTTRLYDGIAEVLDALSGRVAMAVLTNKPLAPSTRLLDHFGIAALFLAVIGGDGAYARKPSPAGLNALIERAGADPASTVFVGDSTVDLETSRHAGVRAAIARYGFGFNDTLAESMRDDDIVLDRAIDLIPPWRRHCRIRSAERGASTPPPCRVSAAHHPAGARGRCRRRRPGLRPAAAGPA